MPAGSVSDEVVAFQDMLPTFAELAGADAPHGLSLDGVSITKALRGEALPKRSTPLYWDYGHCRGDQYVQAVRLGEWKGIRSAKTGQVELYDLKSDLGENRNVAPDHPKLVERIGKVMDAAVTPSPRYPVGTKYRGKPIWQKHKTAGG